MNALQTMLFQPAGGMFREFHGIKAYFKPRDLALYRQLLPPPFEMPASPVVFIFVADYLKVTTPGMRKYQEAAIALSSSYRDHTGWTIVSMPVSNRVAMWAGRSVGFPKYVAKDIRLREDERGWTGQVRRDSSVRLSLEFQPGETGPVAARDQEHLQAPTFFGGLLYLLVPPGVGPQIMEVAFGFPVQPTRPVVLGKACASVGSNEPWAALVDWERPGPAAYCHFVGGMNLLPERLA